MTAVINHARDAQLGAEELNQVAGAVHRHGRQSLERILDAAEIARRGVVRERSPSAERIRDETDAVAPVVSDGPACARRILDVEQRAGTAGRRAVLEQGSVRLRLGQAGPTNRRLQRVDGGRGGRRSKPAATPGTDVRVNLARTGDDRRVAARELNLALEGVAPAVTGDR